MAAAAPTDSDLAQRVITALQEYLASLSFLRTHRTAVTKVLCGETTLANLMKKANSMRKLGEPNALCDAIDAITISTGSSLTALSAAVTAQFEAALAAKVTSTSLKRLYYCCALDKSIKKLGKYVTTLSERIADNILEYEKSVPKRLDLLSTIIADTKALHTMMSSPPESTQKSAILEILNGMSCMSNITTAGVYTTGGLGAAAWTADGGDSGPAAPAAGK